MPTKSRTLRNKMAKRPYFIWDYDISEEQVWEILQGDNETRKV